MARLITEVQSAKWLIWIAACTYNVIQCSGI